MVEKASRRRRTLRPLSAVALLAAVVAWDSDCPAQDGARTGCDTLATILAGPWGDTGQSPLALGCAGYQPRQGAMVFAASDDGHILLEDTQNRRVLVLDFEGEMALSFPLVKRRAGTATLDIARHHNGTFLLLIRSPSLPRSHIEEYSAEGAFRREVVLNPRIPLIEGAAEFHYGPRGTMWVYSGAYDDFSIEVADTAGLLPASLHVQLSGRPPRRPDSHGQQRRCLSIEAVPGDGYALTIRPVRYGEDGSVLRLIQREEGWMLKGREPQRDRASN